MFCSKSVIILRLFAFLLLENAASATPSGTVSARYTNSSTALIPSDAAAGSSTPLVGGYIASGIGLAARGSAKVSSHGISAVHTTDSSSASDNSLHNGTQPTDACWTQWSRYWDLSSKVKTMYTTFTTERVYHSVTGWSIPAWYSTSEVTSTVTEGNGNFPTKTYVTTVITSEKIAQTFATTEANTTDVVTDRISTTITKPTCPLQSYVPQCQESWVSWGSNGAVSYDQPACTQASVSGAMCSSVLSQWLNYQRAELGEISGKIGMQWLPETNNGTTVWPTSTTNYYWPTSSAVAPGCTVGCQSCRVSGSSVKLLYWPPETSGRPNATHLATTGSSKHVITAVTHGTTLTSPTVYISFDKLHASNSCSVIGKTLSNIIVAITNSATLSSLYGWDRYWGLQQTASFNFTDLYVTPVPHSIYMSQPRCASSSISLVYSCAPLGAKAPAICNTSNTPLLCATTLPYEPVIAIPKEVQQLQPDWDGCAGGIIGVYDPPGALTEAAVEDKPTLPAGGGTTIATTTQQAESAPDATTQASPSPTASTVPTATAELTTPKAEPTEASSSSRSSVVEASTSPPEASSPSTPTSNPASPTKTDPSQVTKSSTEAQPSDDSTTQNALDVLSEALTQTTGIQSTGGPLSSVQDSSPSASENGNDASSSAASKPNADSTGGSGSLVFTYDPSTVAEQNTAASSPATQNDPESPSTLSSHSESDPTTTIGNAPLFTFDPSSSSEPTTAAFQPHPTLTIITANDHTFSAIQSGSHIVIIDTSSTQVLTPGQETVIDSSQTLKLQPSQGLVVGDSTIPLNQPPQAAVWTAPNGQTYSALVQGSNIIIEGADTTATIPTAPTILAGQTLSVLPSNEGIVVDGSSVPISVAPTTSTGGAAILTASNGATISAHAAPDHGIVLADPSSTLTLSPGEGTTYQGQSYSVASSGGAVVVDGSSTVAVEETSLPVIATGSSPSNTTTRITTSTSSSHGDEAAASSASASTTASSTGSSAGRMPGGLLLLYILPLLYAYSLL